MIILMYLAGIILIIRGNINSPAHFLSALISNVVYLKKDAHGLHFVVLLH